MGSAVAAQNLIISQKNVNLTHLGDVLRLAKEDTSPRYVKKSHKSLEIFHNFQIFYECFWLSSSDGMEPGRFGTIDTANDVAQGLAKLT